MGQNPHISGISIPEAPSVPPGAWLCPCDGPYPPGAPLITATPENDSPWAYDEDEIVFLWTQIVKILVRLDYIQEGNVEWPPADTGRHLGMNTAYMRDELHMSERVISLLERLPYAFEYPPRKQWRFPVLLYTEAASFNYLAEDPRALAASREPHPVFMSPDQPLSSVRLEPDDVTLLAPDEGDGRSWVLDTKSNTIRTFWDVSQYCDRKVPVDFVDEVPEMEDHYRNWPAFHAPFVLKSYIRDLWDLKFLPQRPNSISSTARFADAFLIARALRDDYGWPDAFRADDWKRDRKRVVDAADEIREMATNGRGGFQDDIIKRWTAHPEEIPELVLPEEE